MRSEYKVRHSYLTDDIQDQFSFDFKIINPAHLLVLFVNVLTDEIVWQTRANDTTYFTTLINADGTGKIVFADPPEIDRKLVLLLADDQPTQPSKYVTDDRYKMVKIENSLDTLSGQIQRIRYLLDRSMKLPEQFTGDFDAMIDEVIPEAVPMTNVAGDKFIMVPRVEFKGDKGDDGSTPNFLFGSIEPTDVIGVEGDVYIDVLSGNIYKKISPVTWELEGNLGSSLPTGADEFAILESVGDDTTRWTAPIVYQGYSENYNEIVNLQGLKATLDYVMKMGYAPPTINLLSSVANGLRERGDLITAMTLSGVVGKVLDDIAEVRFYDQSTSTLLDTQISGPAIPNGGTNTYNWAGSFGNNKTFRVEVDDVSAQPKPSRTATLTYSFVYPYYVGAGAAGLGAGVSALTKRIINSTANRQELITVNGSQKMYFAYPSSYGALTSILDVNNFNTINDWTRTTVNITGLDGNSVSYYVYEFNNYALAGTYQYNFVR